MKPTTHGNGSTELPRADLPQPADNARRNTVETDNGPRVGQVTATTTQARKLLGAWRFTRKPQCHRIRFNQLSTAGGRSCPHQLCHFGPRKRGPIGNRLSPIAVEARRPVLRACAGRLVAPDRSTVHRTSAPAHSPGAAGGLRRPGHLRRDQVGATIIAYGVQGPQHHPRGLQHHLDQHTVGDRQGVRQAGSAGRSPYTNPTRAYTAVMRASKPDDVSSPDELLGIGPREAQDRRLALMAHQRWESEGGALRRRGHERG